MLREPADAPASGKSLGCNNSRISQEFAQEYHRDTPESIGRLSFACPRRPHVFRPQWWSRMRAPVPRASGQPGRIVLRAAARLQNLDRALKEISQSVLYAVYDELVFV